MDDSEIWSVDRLAAGNLLARLQFDATPDALVVAARQFAEHRQTAAEWAAKRAHANIMEALEETSQRYFPDHGEEWCAGYCRAQQQAAAMTSIEMLQMSHGKAPSQGQILRRLMRRARQQ